MEKVGIREGAGSTARRWKRDEKGGKSPHGNHGESALTAGSPSFQTVWPGEKFLFLHFHELHF
jgi:hypothetical protein